MGDRIHITDDLLRELVFLKAVAEKATAGRPDGKPGFALTAPGPFVLAFPMEPHQLVVARRIGIHVTDEGMLFPFWDVADAKAVAAQLAILQEELARIGIAAGWAKTPPEPAKTGGVPDTR